MEVVRAAVDRPPAARAAFLAAACGADEDLRQAAAALLDAYDTRDTFLETPPLDGWDAASGRDPAAALVGQRLGPYRLEAVLGRGGMGVVYRACRADEQFDKQVAIKLVAPAPGLPVADLARRLRRERQVLAGLDHPNIARLLDGGATDDGLPYVVMEHVDGEPIDAYCDRRALSVASRLRLLASVCRAVQFAHQHLIVHRDLKPGNILVRPDGTPILLDFGIATALTPDAARALRLTLTGAGSGPLTAAYASPEQVRGEPITTASDVYGLGLVLYELLTGRPAHRLTTGHLPELERVVCRTDPPRPSLAVRQPIVLTEPGGEPRLVTADAVSATREGTPARLGRRLAGDVDAIALMALRKEPGQRYASAADLAADIERHLTGRPVRARGGARRYRAGKFLRRHLAGVLAAALVLLSLGGGLVATLWQAQVADAHRLRAERRADEGRRLSRSLMVEIYDEIAAVPGTTAARELLARRARDYLDTLASEAGDDLALLRELAAAYTRLGHVQGGVGVTNLGDTAGALASYRQALELRQRLSTAESADAADRRELAGLHWLIGDLLVRTGDLPGALTGHQQALAIRTALAEADPTAVDARLDLAASLTKLGEVQARTGDLAGALARHRHAVALLETAVTADLAGGRARLDLGLSHERIGELLGRMGDTAGALASQRQAVAVREAHAAVEPTSQPVQRALSSGYINLGHRLIRTGEMGAALQSFHRALTIREALASDGRDAQAQRDVNVVRSTLGDLLAVTGDTAGAVAMHRRTATSRETLAAADPANAQARRDLGVSSERLGDALVAAGDTAGALAAHRQALTVRQALVTSQDTRARRDLGGSHNRVGDLLLRTGDPAGARAHHQAALAIQEALTGDARDTDARLDLALSHDGLGDVLARTGDPAGALDHYHQALAIRSAQAAVDTQNAELQRDLSGSHHRVAAGLLLAGDQTGALTSHRQGLALRERLATAHPDDRRAQRDLAASLAAVGAGQARLGDTGAPATAERALALVEPLVAADPADALARRILSTAHESLGDGLTRAGDPVGALAAYRRAAALVAGLAAADPLNLDLRADQDRLRARLAPGGQG
jgi:non-specific serine/threonine protein kinase/serine/threonine-protein kinase